MIRPPGTDSVRTIVSKAGMKMYLGKSNNHKRRVNMRVSGLFVAIVLLAASLAAFGQGKDAMAKKPEAKSTTMTGEVVDVSCYLAHGDGGKGDAHKECAAACAKHGGPLGILTDDGKLFVSVLPDDHKNGPNALLADHVAQKVEVTGIVRTKGGTNAIMITKVNPAGGGAK